MDQWNNEKILVVEDSEDDALLLCRAFAKAGIIGIQTVYSAAQAMEYLKGDGIYTDRSRFPFPCLVLLDMSMPGKSGLEVLKWIRLQPSIRRIPVVGMTSLAHPELVNMAYDYGINSFLEKPTSLSELEEAMNALKDYWFSFSRHPECLHDPIEKKEST